MMPRSLKIALVVGSAIIGATLILIFIGYKMNVI